MKKIVRIALTLLIAFTATPFIANANQLSSTTESVVLTPSNSAINEVNKIIKDEEPAKETKKPLQKRIDSIKKAAHDGGVVIGISSVALLVIIILLLIILL